MRGKKKERKEGEWIMEGKKGRKEVKVQRKKERWKHVFNPLRGKNFSILPKMATLVWV
jgi:hypothetical protein